MTIDGKKKEDSVLETSLAEVLEALAERLEAQAADAIEGLRQQAARIRSETSASASDLREQAARLRDELHFNS